VTYVTKVRRRELPRANETNTAKREAEDSERVQTGVRIERRILAVLKELAEWRGWSLGRLIEELALSALAGPERSTTPLTESELRLSLIHI